MTSKLLASMAGQAPDDAQLGARILQMTTVAHADTAKFCAGIDQMTNNGK